MNEPACIVCGKDLPSALLPSEPGNYPYGATIFCSHGNYGSTLFDSPTTARYLEVNICDICLELAAKNGQVLVCESVTVTNIESEVWDPTDEN